MASLSVRPINGKGAKDKGANGEREYLKLLGTHLEEIGYDVPENGFQRNLEQTRSGGFDNNLGEDLAHFAIEIRRREQLSLGSWWSDVTTKAALDNRVPVVAYRQNRKPWAMLLPYYERLEEFQNPNTMTGRYLEPIQVGMYTFARIIKRTIEGIPKC